MSQIGTLDKAFNVAALIVGLGIVAVIFKSKQTAPIVKQVGNLFQGSITAAQHG